MLALGSGALLRTLPDMPVSADAAAGSATRWEAKGAGGWGAAAGDGDAGAASEASGCVESEVAGDSLRFFAATVFGSIAGWALFALKREASLAFCPVSGLRGFRAGSFASLFRADGCEVPALASLLRFPFSITALLYLSSPARASLRPRPRRLSILGFRQRQSGKRGCDQKVEHVDGPGNGPHVR